MITLSGNQTANKIRRRETTEVLFERRLAFLLTSEYITSALTPSFLSLSPQRSAERSLSDEELKTQREKQYIISETFGH